MMLSCTTNKYDLLYAPWLERAEALLTMAKYNPKKHVLLDLAGGTGIVSREAVKQGADPKKVFLYDLNPRCPNTDIIQIGGRAEDLDFPDNSFDVIVCRQAMAYLDPALVIPKVAKALKPGGVFVFNTFDKPVSNWRIKHYKHKGARYLETFIRLWGDTIWHSQTRFGLGTDVTKFKYVSDKYLKLLLNRDFDCNLITSGSSLRWVCTRRSKP